VDGPGDDDVPVVPVDGFLAYLTGIGRSPNTVKAYAHDLKDYWEFITLRGLDWREARLEDVGEFVIWLQLPPAGRAGEVAVLPSVPVMTPCSPAGWTRCGSSPGISTRWTRPRRSLPRRSAVGDTGPRNRTCSARPRSSRSWQPRTPCPRGSRQ